MSIPATTTFGNPDPSARFTTLQDLVTLLNTLVGTVLPNDLMPYVIGSATPNVDDQDKPWIRLDGAGRPVGTYIFYGALWVREPPDPGSYIGLYAGDPSVDFDGTGKGLAGPGPVAMPFYGWQLLNGQNGVADLSNRFVIGANMANLAVGYDSGWKSDITGTPEGTGGAAETTLTDAVTYRPARSALTAAKYSADGNVQGGALWGDPNGSTDFTALSADAGNTAPDPISIVPNFFALAYVQFVGYP